MSQTVGTLVQRITTETTQYEAVVQKIDDILNGDVNAVITVTSGTIPSIRKAVNDALTTLATASAANMGTTITEINNKIDAIETYLGDETNPAADTVRRLLIDLQASITGINNNIGDLAADDPQGSGTIAERLASARTSGGGTGGISQATFDAARIGLPADTADNNTSASLWAQFKNALNVINNILGGQAGHTAVNVNNINLRVLDQRLGNSSTPSAEDSTKVWGRVRWLGTTLTTLRDLVGAISATASITATTLWGQFNQVKAWLGSPSGSLSYYQDQNTSSILSANASSEDVWGWLTRFSFSIRNLKNRKLDTSTFTAARVGAPDDAASADTTASLWAQFKQSLANAGSGGGISQAAFDALSNLVGTRPSLTYYYFTSATASAISSANANTQSVWTWLTRFSTSIKNLADKFTAARIGLPANAASSATSATLWAQFKQSLVTLGNKLNTSTWTAARVGNPSDTASSATTASLWAQFKQSLATPAGVTQATFNTLSNLVGGRPSTTYYYFASATASTISSANANTQAVWSWLTRFSNSIKNLADNLGNSSQTASSTGTLWQQFLQLRTDVLAGSGGGSGGVTQAAFNVLSDAVGLATNAANIAGSTLWAQFNQIKEWVGSPSGNLSYYADQNTSSISSASANSQDIWTWLTRFSFSIRNLKNRKLDISTWTAARVGAPDDTADSATTASLWAQFKHSLTNTGGGGGGGVSQATFQALADAVGAVADAANLAGDTLWGQFNKIKEMVLNRALPREIFAYQFANLGGVAAPTASQVSVNANTGAITFSNDDIASGWTKNLPAGHFIYDGNSSNFKIYRARANLIFNETSGYSIGNWEVEQIGGSPDQPRINATNIAALQAQVGAGNTSRTVADITQEDATQDQWSIGNIVGDLLTGVLNYVKGTPTPIDYTIQLSSTARTGGSLGANESLIDGHWVFGFTRANVALPNIANTIPGSSLGEVAPNVTGDLGNDIDAVLNVTNHSLSSGYMLVAMKLNADYVPKNLRVRTSGGTETVNHSLQLSQTTATHKIYVTDHSDDLQWGDVFGISSEGNFTADIGFRDANNENYLQGDIQKSFAPFPLSKYTRTFFGAMKDIPRVEKPGDMYIADDGDILISKEILTGDSGYIIYPISTGNRYFGFSAETIGAISTFLAPVTGGVNANIQKTITKLLYDSVNDEIVVDFNKKNLVVEGARGLSVKTGRVVILNDRDNRYSVINTPLVIKPEADSIGSYPRYAGCKSPVRDTTQGYKHPTITPAYSGTAATYFGALMNPIVGYKRTASGTSYGTSSDNGNWKTGDTIVVDRSMPDRAVRVTSRAESHTEIKGMVMGQKINFEEEGSLTGGSGGTDNRELHFRIPAANASGALNTNEGSIAQTNHDIGIYEVKLEFHNSGDGSYIHVCLPANYISGTQKLALFLKPITPGAAADFDKMDLSNDKYYVLSYHSKIHDWSDSIAGTYARYKWDLSDNSHTQLAAHFDADINGSMFVGLAVIEETGSGNDRSIDDFTSWLPIPYEQIYVDGVHIDLTLDSVRAIRAGSTRSRLEYNYKTNSYTQSQRDKYYADSVPETEKDILVNGRAVAVNLKNRRGMYHIPFDITHIKPFIKDEPFYVNFTFDTDRIGKQETSITLNADFLKSIAWDRVVRAETHSHNESEDSTDITESMFEVFNPEIEPDYTKQEKHAIDSVSDLYPSKILAIPFDKGSVYERDATNSNDMDDSDLISEKQSFAVDSDAIEGSVIIEDIYLNSGNTGTNQITFRVGHDIANSSTTLPDTIIHHPLSGAKLTIPGVAASTVRATKAYQDGKRVFSVSSGADWDKAVSLVRGDKISVQLMGGQAHNSPQLVWYKLIN